MKRGVTRDYNCQCSAKYVKDIVKLYNTGTHSGEYEYSDMLLVIRIWKLFDCAVTALAGQNGII